MVDHEALDRTGAEAQRTAHRHVGEGGDVDPPPLGRHQLGHLATRARAAAFSAAVDQPVDSRTDRRRGSRHRGATEQAAPGQQRRRLARLVLLCLAAQLLLQCGDELGARRVGPGTAGVQRGGGEHLARLLLLGGKARRAPVAEDGGDEGLDAPAAASHGRSSRAAARRRARCCSTLALLTVMPISPAVSRTE